MNPYTTYRKKESGDRLEREEHIKPQCERFVKYLYDYYNYRNNSIGVCVEIFKRKYSYAPCASFQQVYNWINTGKINIRREELCYKKKKKLKKRDDDAYSLEFRKQNSLPIRLMLKHIELCNEVGHLEIDSILGKKNEYDSII